MRNEKDIALIYRFLDEGLTQDEIKLFRERYKKDPDFAREVRQAIDSIAALQAAWALRQQLEEEELIDIKKPRMINTFWYAAAAILIVIIISGVLLLLLKKPSDPDQIYTMYFTDPDYLMETQVKAFVDTTITQIKPEEIEQASDIEERFTSGIRLMQEEKFIQASEIFRFIIDDKYNLYIEEAEWYIGLCYLKLDKIEDAKALFEKIGDSKSLYQKRAKGLIRKIKNIK